MFLFHVDWLNLVAILNVHNGPSPWLSELRIYCVKFVLISDFGDESINVVAKIFQEVLRRAEVDIQQLSEEWLDMKSRIYFKVENDKVSHLCSYVASIKQPNALFWKKTLNSIVCIMKFYDLLFGMP